jgi:hypothetical protein
MDGGQVVNQKTARNQIIGGVTFGIGMALLEKSQLEEKTGRYANANFAEYLENDGRLEHAQQMAGHESPRTTKLYDRTKDEITLSEVERIRL